MATPTLTERAPEPRSRPLDRVLGHPAAFLATASLLILLFGGTFFQNPDRVAPTKDPAYYTWRTEALMTEKPVDLLAVEGAFGMFEGGYRVTAPVLGGMLRQIADVAPLRSTVVLMVAAPVITALLLAGFAYRHRRDPLLWHAVALGSASLMLTPPFVGYLDNVLCLLFLAAALYFIPGTSRSWGARIGFGSFLLLAGLTHPTSLVIFCLVLGMMAGVRLLLSRFDIRETWRADGPMLLTGFGAAVLTFLVWTIGIWGKSSSLSEAALAPPYGSEFFIARLNLWLASMRPALNGPLLILGISGLLVAGKRALVEDELTRVSILWLAPLVGIFGFLAGKAYPYYRFFNATLSWVLLLGVGMYFALRFFLDIARRGGMGLVGYVGVAAILLVIATNFTKGFDVSGWNNASGGWLSSSQRTDLDALRSRLSEPDAAGRPVVFVIDDEVAANDEFQIWGFTKLSGNTSRYGLPPGSIDEGYLYLGSLENLLSDEPTLKGFETYDKLSPALLEDAREGIERAGEDPIFVVAKAFNSEGENSDLFTAGAEFEDDVWFLQGGEVSEGASTQSRVVLGEGFSPERSNMVLVIVGLLLLTIPGLLAFRWFFPEAGLAEALGMVPALSAAILSLVGTGLLAVIRSPFSTGAAVATLVVSAAIGALLYLLSGGRPRGSQQAGRRVTLPA